MSTSDRSHQNCFFQEWIKVQQEDLSELLQARVDPDAELSQLVEKGINRFQDYIDQRIRLAREDISTFFAPSWCTSLENSLLWIAGCRPTAFIRLVYALSGSEIEARLNEFLRGETTGDLSELSSNQLSLINGLQGKTIREEDKLTSRLASLQEDIAGQPITMIAKAASQIAESNGEVELALDKHARGMTSMLEEADKLRLSTLKELMSILTTVQAVDFLVASKKLHLCIHAWGLKLDRKHGRD